MAISTGKAIGESFSVTSTYFKTLIAMMAVPLVLTILLRFASYFAVEADAPQVDPNADPQAALGQAGFQILFGIAAFVIAIPFVTAWYRFCISKGRADPGQIRYAFGNREFAYLGYSLLLILITLGVLIVPAVLLAAAPAFGVLMLLAALPLLLYLYARFTLVLPAAAVGQRMSLGESWRATRESAWSIVGLYALMLLIVLGISLGIGLVSMVILLAFGGIGQPPSLPAFAIVTFITEPFGFYIAALIATAIAYVFRELVPFNTSILEGPQGPSGPAA